MPPKSNRITEMGAVNDTIERHQSEKGKKRAAFENSAKSTAARSAACKYARANMHVQLCSTCQKFADRHWENRQRIARGRRRFTAFGEIDGELALRNKDKRFARVCLFSSPVAFYIFSSCGASGPGKIWRSMEDGRSAGNKPSARTRRRPQRIRSSSSTTRQRPNTRVFIVNISMLVTRCIFLQLHEEKGRTERSTRRGARQSPAVNFFTLCVLYCVRAPCKV